MSDTIFTKIIRGEIPSYKIYEDEHTYALLDIHPKQPGHVLVIPKQPVDHIWDLPDEQYTALMRTVKMIGLRVRDKMTADRVAIQVEGIGVPHVHVHVFPFSTSEEFHTQPNPDGELDHKALTAIAQTLAF